MRYILPFVFLLLNPITAWGFSATETQNIKELVLETLRENPEILIELSTLLKEKQAQQRAETVKKTIAVYSSALFHDDNAPTSGNPDGDITIVEFFDYNCGYCKKAAGEIRQLLATDTNIKMIYREWPVLSEGSVFGAKAALAARKQGMYAELHQALMSAPRVDEISTLAVAEKLGLDVGQLQKDMQASEVEQHINTSRVLAQAFGFTGTPSMVIGNDVALGFLPFAALQERVKAARKRDK